MKDVDIYWLEDVNSEKYIAKITVSEQCFQIRTRDGYQIKDLAYINNMKKLFAYSDENNMRIVDVMTGRRYTLDVHNEFIDKLSEFGHCYISRCYEEISKKGGGWWSM